MQRSRYKNSVGDYALRPFGLSQSEKFRKWYEENRDHHLAKTNARHKRVRGATRQFIAEYLLDHPCVDCGEDDPIVLDFDHVGEKLFGISTAVQRSMNLERVKTEIAKCEIRCANCHRRKTHRTFNHGTRYLTKETDCEQ